MLLFSWPVLAQPKDEAVVVRGDIAEDLYLAGPSVDVSGTLAGDVLAAGGRVDVRGQIQGDVMAAAGVVDIQGTLADDLRAAGGDVNVRAAIAGDAVLAGGLVTLSPETKVAGRAWLAGRDIIVRGAIGRELRAAGQRVVIGGVVGGDVWVQAGEVEVLPAARIHGNLSYQSPVEARIHPGARIAGAVRFEPRAGPPAAAPIGAAVAFAFYASLTVAATVLYLLFARFAAETAWTLRVHPWRSLGVGLVALVMVPVVAVILAVTVLGLPLGLALLALYFPYLFAGFLLGTVSIAHAAWHAAGRQTPGRGAAALGIALVFVVLALLQWLPGVGPLALMLVLLFGLGAMTLQAYGRYTYSSRPSA